MCPNNVFYWSSTRQCHVTKIENKLFVHSIKYLLWKIVAKNDEDKINEKLIKKIYQIGI